MTLRRLRLAIVIGALGAFGSAYATTDECSGGPNGGMGASGSVAAPRAPTQ